MQLPTNLKKYFNTLYQTRVKDLGLNAFHLSTLKNGKKLFSGNYGYASSNPKRELLESTRFPVASITKIFAATRILQLVEEGKCKLTTPVGDIIPGLKRSNRLRAVTLEALLSHNAAIIRDGHDASYWSYFKEPLTQKELITELNDTAVKIINHPPSYSNYGFAILGVAISELEDATYEKSILENIIKPLRLSSTSFEFCNKTVKRYKKLDGKLYQLPPSPKGAFNPAAGIISTPKDLHRFLAQLFFERSLIQSQKLFKKLIQSRGEFEKHGGYALGLRLTSFGDETAYGHGGADVGCYSYAGVLLKSKQTYVSYDTEGQADFVGDPRQACKGFHLLLTEFAKTRKGKFQPSLLKALRKKEGIYQDFWGRFYHLDNISEVVGLDLNTWVPSETMFRIKPVGKRGLSVRQFSKMFTNDEPVRLAQKNSPFEYFAGGHPLFRKGEFREYVKRLLTMTKL